MFTTRSSIRIGLFVMSATALLNTGCPPPPPAPTPPVADFLVQRDPVDFTVEGEPEFFPENPLVGFDPQQVQFVDLSDAGTRDITIWRWNFGDGNISEERDPLHTYDKVGNYTVSLTVANGLGTSRETKTNLVQIKERVGPTADFDYSPERGLDPLTVRFSDRSESGVSEITRWDWNFGDGNTSTLQNPTHEYRALGTYDVSLTVTTDVGSNTYTEPAAVSVVSPIEASFEPSVESGKVPLTVSFSNTSQEGVSTDVTWSWDFGDGAISSARNPTHEYKLPGLYTVTLTADNGVRSDTVVREALIEVITPVAPTAAFGATPTGGNAPLTVLFRDRSENGTEPIESWEWYFGDMDDSKGEGEGEGEGDVEPPGGADSTEQSPIHVYETPGSYTVTLVVRSADGESIETKENFINVFSPLAADFTVDATSGLTPLTVQFTDASSIGAGPVLSRTWNFGDGNTSSETNPQHTYVTPGTYSVELTVTTPDGTVTETKADLIEAIEPIAPSAEFSATPTAGPAPLDVAFTNESDPGTGADIGYTWDFGDGNMSTEESPAHTYNLLGTYTVGLEVVSSVGTSSETKVDLIQAQTPTLTSGGDAADRLRAIVVATDDSFAVAGDTRSFGGGETQPYFLRYGADGNLISEHAYTAQGNARAMDLVGTPDGGFVLVGNVETAENGLDVLAVKVDSNGNEVWRNVIGVAANDRGTAVVRTAGGFLIAGNTDRNGNQDVLLVRLDGEGNLLWTEVYGGASFDLANDVIEVSDSFWIVGSTGRNAGAGSDVLLLRVGLGGAFISDVTYGTPQEDRGNAVLFFEDSLVIAGATGSGAGASDAWVIRTAAGPVPTWTRTLGGDGEEEAFDLVALAGGDLVIAGSTTSDGNGLFDVFLARITSNGDEVWTEKLGDTGSEIAFGLGLTSGDNLLPAGQSDSFGSGSLDALVLKAGPDGGQLQFP